MFDADAILEKQKATEIKKIVLDRLDLPEDMEPPVLKLKITQDVKRRARQAKRRHNNIQGGFEGGRAIWTPIDEPEKYVEAILNLCFDGIEGLFNGETPKEIAKKAFLVLINDKEKTVKYIASLLMALFEGQDENTDVKN